MRHPAGVWNSNPNVVMQMAPSSDCVPASTLDPTSPLGGDCFYQYEKLDADDIGGAFFGRKVLALSYGGSIQLRGSKASRTGAIDANPSDSGTSWVRLAASVAPGANSIYLDRPVPTWAGGDHIVLTTTDYQPSHTEELVISGIASDAKGTRVDLVNPAAYAHWGQAYDYSDLPAGSGPRDDSNRPATQASRHVENRAMVALLTRSIMIASEGETPVLADRSAAHFPSGYFGGHTLMRSGFARYQVQGVEYYQLGQGGKIGRYPIHFHMDRNVPQPTTDPASDGTYVADCAIHESNTRFITVHATQGLLLARNVGYLSIGHGFYLEDATETNNRLYANLGIQSIGAVNSALNKRSRESSRGQGNPAQRSFPSIRTTTILPSSGS